MPRARFQCPAPIFAEEEWTDGKISAEEMADKVLSWTRERAPPVARRASEEAFSQVVLDHPFQKERGTYTITLVASYLAEGQVSLARDTVERIRSGELRAPIFYRIGDQTFFDLAAEWLDARQGEKTIR